MIMTESPTLAPATLAAFDGTRFCPHCHRASLVVHHGCHRCTECGYKECEAAAQRGRITNADDRERP